MNILVLQTVRYDLIGYDRAIDHNLHRVFYVGTKEKLAQIPHGLRCEMVEREGLRPVFDEVADLIESLDQCFDFLISVSEQELIDAARLRARFGIPGPTPAQAEKVRDKTVMKRCVEAAGIRAPRFASLDQWLAGHRLPIAEGDAVILKPVDGASSANVKRFESERHLAEALASRQTGVAVLDGGAYDASRFEVEEFVDGTVMHIDGIARHGVIQILLASRYVSTPMAFAHGKPVGSVQVEYAPLMQNWTTRILAAVEIRDGAFHLEIIDSKDGPVFLEIAHRVGGARITEAFERKTGIHLAVADIRTITDPDYVLESVWDRSSYYGWFIVPSHQLQKPYCRVSGHESLLTSGMVLELNQLGPDKPVPQKVTYAETLLPLAGLLRAPRSEDMLDALETLFDELILEGMDEPDVATGA
jgi:hypothetical protein